ncbi:uncharacterized protein N7515_009208 [Penicillium bovifimosum]|uniref:Uncharacterized protein n=1 Tax=Penicillium bovifimosum TaxID=126998 RepID=A0A9W9GIV1_9EURO|nr:uncharacterized protein N7515_009208 [Penicillium bovifimosum]KAJ5121247.1 hypothetical protein N7515_009208 [Penicillium bovifimosum]
MNSSFPPVFPPPRLSSSPRRSSPLLSSSPRLSSSLRLSSARRLSSSRFSSPRLSSSPSSFVRPPPLKSCLIRVDEDLEELPSDEPFVRKSVHFPNDADLEQVRPIPARDVSPPCSSEVTSLDKAEAEDIGAFDMSALLEVLSELDGSTDTPPPTPVHKPLEVPVTFNPPPEDGGSRVVVQTRGQVGPQAHSWINHLCWGLFVLAFIVPRLAPALLAGLAFLFIVGACTRS